MKAIWDFARLLPRNTGILLLRGYRAVISPLYGQVCRYYPSCSAYTLESVQQYGLLRGSWRGGRRILRCHPWARGGVDEVPPHPRGVQLNNFGFVIATGEGKHGIL
jgi:putative membrane protein insertion efficiency factor